MSHLFAMGGYAAYVWPSFALTLLALVMNVVWAQRSLARARTEARRRLEMQAVRT